MRWVRGIGGVVSGGLVALMLIVAGAAVLGHVRDYPGPGNAVVSWHVAAAAGAVGAQRFADRREGRAALLAVVLIMVIAVALLWCEWYR